MDKLEYNYLVTTKLFTDNSSRIISDAAASQYPQSHRALFNGQRKIDSLLLSMEVVRNQDIDSAYYSIQALHRIIVEHFLLAHYIWTKTRLEKNDNCGVEYYAHYRLSELLKRENYNLGIEGIEQNLKNNANFQNLQKQIADDGKPLTQTDYDDIHRTGNQFDIKSIFRYLLNQVPTDDHFTDMHKSLAYFLRAYNNLSSYVHGGPSAEVETYYNEAPVDKNKAIFESIQYAKIASRTIKEHIIMLLVEEKPEYLDILQPIMDLKK